MWLETKQFCSKSFTLGQRKIIFPVWAFQQQKHLNGFHYILRTWWKSVGNNYIHWSLDLCFRPVSGWREERGDLMIRNNCHCTLNRERWPSLWLWKCLLPNCSRRMKLPVFFSEAVINTCRWFLQVDKLLAKTILNISTSPPYTHSQLVLLKTSTEFNYSNAENTSFLKKSQITMGDNDHPANSQ